MAERVIHLRFETFKILYKENIEEEIERQRNVYHNQINKDDFDYMAGIMFDKFYRDVKEGDKEARIKKKQADKQRKERADKERIEIAVKSWRAYNATKSDSEKLKLSEYIKMMKAQCDKALGK